MTAPVQLPDESARAYAAFKSYVGDPQRSIRRCARRLRKSSTIVARWSRRYHWQNRIRKMELENCKRAVKADEKAKLTVAEERERERLKFQQRAVEVSRRATEKGLQILKQPLKGTKPGDAARLLAVADAIGRSALGLAGDVAGGAFGLTPVATPVITVIHQSDEQSKEVERIQKQFIADHPDDPAVVGFLERTNPEHPQKGR